MNVYKLTKCTWSLVNLNTSAIEVLILQILQFYCVQILQLIMNCSSISNNIVTKTFI